MNAPARIRPDTESLEAAHRASISVHCPNEGDGRMASRVAIAVIRDQASAGLRRCSPEAAGILAEVSRLATHAVYAPMPPGKLHMTRFALASLLESARHLERAVNWSGRGDG